MLQGKNILIISPEPWSDMHISKHHYAIELTIRGNFVFFLNPVKNTPSLSIKIHPHFKVKNLFLISFSCIITYRAKFHFRWLFNLFLHTQIRRILHKIGRKIDIVWDFDRGHLYQDYSIFRSELNIFHPVDQGSETLPPQKRPDVIFSVSSEILDFYSQFTTPHKYFINHGLGDVFAELAKQRLEEEYTYEPNEKLEAAYIGNLMIPYIGHNAILNVIQNHTDVIFHFFGPYSLKLEKNLTLCAVNFINKLNSFPNVHLHGLTKKQDIVAKIRSADILFFYYHSAPGYNSDNTHKILEYLSTGRIVIGSVLSSYRNLNLYQQANTEEEWIAIFAKTVKQIGKHNTIEQQHKRLKFVLENTYNAQLTKINEILLNIHNIKQKKGTCK